MLEIIVIAGIQTEIVCSGVTALVIRNKGLGDPMEIQSLEDTGILIKGCTKAIEND